MLLERGCELWIVTFQHGIKKREPRSLYALLRLSREVVRRSLFVRGFVCWWKKSCAVGSSGVWGVRGVAGWGKWSTRW